MSEAGVADPLGDGEAGDRDSGEEVVPELGQAVPGGPLQDGEVVLHGSPGAPSAGKILERTERVVGEERLLEVGGEGGRERPLAHQIHSQAEVACAHCLSLSLSLNCELLSLLSI